MGDKHWISAEGSSIHYDYMGYVREQGQMYGYVVRMLSWRAVVVTLAFVAVGLVVWWWQTALGTSATYSGLVWEPQVVDLDFNGVKVRKYIPSGGPSSEAGIIYIHGGGWQHGSVDSYDEVTKWFSVETGMMVVSVEYRLAPNHVFPAAIDDCETVTRHFLSVADKYGVDPHRVAIVGDSAGGNLAAAVSLRMRDRNVVPPLKAQVLVYPATQALDLRLPSYIRSLNSRGGLTAHHMAKYWLDYAIGNGSHIQRVLDNTHISPDTRKRLKKYVNNDAVVIMSSMDTPHKTLWQQLEPIITNPYFSPGLADDLSRLPRTLILTAGQDPLHDDGEIYAKRLKESGNDVTHRDYPTAHHGIFKHMDIIETRKMRGEIKEFLVQTL